jgi:hypothetical protein
MVPERANLKDMECIFLYNCIGARFKVCVCGRSLAGIAVSNPTGSVCLSVCCECCVLSGRGLYVGLITRPEESYRLWRV